jgi:O-antigen chain-terminating methyltransferase
MSAHNDLSAALAREVRAAVAQTARESGMRSQSQTSDPAAVRQALARASVHVTPVIPEGAPLARAKALALRALRFLWRGQAAFNAASLEGSLGLASWAEQVERAGRDLRRDLESGLEELRRRSAVQEARLTVFESTPVGPPGERPAPVAAAAVPPGVYSLFEERFRGTPAEISGRQRFYLQVLESLPGPVLDVGCGRGEFLALLRAAGIRASGVESNPVAAALCRADGLEVEEGDALEILSRRQAGSLGAVVAFQVVEHWPPEAVFRFLREAARVLAPGGVLVAETINADSLSALRAFYLDPTHVRPLPPRALQFLAEAAGFPDTRIEFRSPFTEGEKLVELTENDAKLNALLFAPQDYALVARAPQAPRETR